MDQLQLERVLMFVLALVVVAFAPHQTLSQTPPTLNQALPGCSSTCGNVQIPYPFGIGNSSTSSQAPCFINPTFNLTCNNSALTWGNIPVLDIQVLTNQMDVNFFVARYCTTNNGTNNKPWLRTFSSFTISSNENKLLTVGADSYGYVNSFFNGESYSTGCLTSSHGNTMKMSNGTCSGIGCCQADIPPGMWNISVRARVFPNSSLNWGDCSNSFVVKNGFYNFSTTDLHSFRYDRVPLVLDWTVGNKSCTDSKSGPDYACKENSYCDDEGSYGYKCRCRDGYQGNPYLGCTGHGGTAIKIEKRRFSLKRENKGSFPFKGKQRSRHQHLFMENVRKTKEKIRDGLRFRKNGFGSCLRMGKVLAPHAPVTKTAAFNRVCKIIA